MRISAPPTRLRSLAYLGLAASLTALAAACSSSSSSSSAAISAISVTPLATPTAAALSGQQLAQVLLPAKSMPKGYTAGPATRNTGSQLASDTAQPMPASQVCQAFTQSSYIRAAGITTNDWAESDYVSADQSQEITEEIDIFTGTDAQKAMAALWQEFGKCSSFSYKTNGTTATNTLTRGRISGVGDEAIKAVIVSPLFQGGETIVAVRTGSQVITTLDSSTGTDLGSPAVGYAEKITQRLRAAR